MRAARIGAWMGLGVLPAMGCDAGVFPEDPADAVARSDGGLDGTPGDAHDPGDGPDRGGAEVGPPEAGPDLSTDLGTDLGTDRDRGFDAEGADGQAPGDAASDRGASLDAGPDAEPEPPPAPPVVLDISGARIEGTGHRRADGAWLLDRGTRLVVPAVVAGAHARPAVFLEAAAWRFEDTAVRVTWGGVEVEGHTAHDGRLRFEPVRLPAPYDRFGPGARAPVARLAAPGAPAEPADLTIEAVGGGLWLRGLALGDPRLPPVDAAVPAPGDVAALPVGPEPAPVIIEPLPCAEPGCDDGAALTAAVAAVPAAAGPLVVRLAAAEYTLRTPWQVRRAGVTVVGAGAAGRLVWDPAEARFGGALDVRGAGTTGPEHGVRGTRAFPSPPEPEPPEPMPPEPVPESEPGAVAADHRVFTVAAPADFAPTFVRLTSDVFGEIPAVCINGRDREHPIRHVNHLARVLAAQPGVDAAGAAVVTLTLDRGIGIDLPAGARPRVQAVGLLADFAAVDLHLRGACPEAIDAVGYGRAPCANPAVVDDDALALYWTVDARLLRTRVEAFGAYGHRAESTLDTHLEHIESDHGANFGEGGRGYGLHLIGANRTRVWAPAMRRTRHGVVVDFGSSDSQVLGGAFRDSSSFVVDIHGEASRDSLVRDNRVADASAGLVAGGGGNAVHCDDGPRHHLLSNGFERTTRALAVADATGAVYLEGNDVSGGFAALTVTTAAGPIWARGNRFAGATAAPIVMAGAGPLFLERNVFVDRCDQATALLGTEADARWSDDNRFCPE